MNAPLLLVLTLLFNAVTAIAGPARSSADENAPAVNTLSRSEIYKKMEQTLFDIRSTFQAMKNVYPQLADIDDSTIKKDGITDNGRIRFDYERGILKESFTEGAAFKRDGCDMFVQIVYPATPEEFEERRLKGTLVTLKNGESYAVWWLVRARRDDEGQKFIDKANEIISSHLQALQEALQ